MCKSVQNILIETRGLLLLSNKILKVGGMSLDALVVE